MKTYGVLLITWCSNIFKPSLYGHVWVYLTKPSTHKLIDWYSLRCFLIVLVVSTSYTGWWFQCLWKILVSWDDYSQYTWKKMFQTTNQLIILGKIRPSPILRLNMAQPNLPNSWQDQFRCASLRCTTQIYHSKNYPDITHVIPCNMCIFSWVMKDMMVILDFHPRCVSLNMCYIGIHWFTIFRHSY